MVVYGCCFNPGSNGYNGSFSYLQTEAIGGGGGGSRNTATDPSTMGENGGSGGGSARTDYVSPPRGGLGTVINILKYDGTILKSNYSQGFDGGAEYNDSANSTLTANETTPFAGGGGGAGGRGMSGYEAIDQGVDGNGGIGKSGEGSIDFKTVFGINNTNIGDHHTDGKVYFSGGGASGSVPVDYNGENENIGGLGGGGDGLLNETNRNGSPNTGGGGAGGKSKSGSNGGNGGSGIIIIRINQPIDMMANEDESVALSAIPLDESSDITDENGVVTADINISVSLQANHSDIEVVDTTGITFVEGSANNSPSVTFEGAMDKVQTALDSIVIRPPAGFTGSDSIAVDISDLSNGGSGTAQTISNTFIISVSAVNDPIDIALPADPTVNEDNSITITGIAVSDDGDVNASQGITNDTLTARVTLDVDHGFMALNSLDDITVVESSKAARFDLTSMDGLQLWLDASNIDGQNNSTLLDGDAIPVWNDLSGNENNVKQSDADSNPIVLATDLNGLDVVSFDGTNDYLQSTYYQQFCR